MTPGCYIRERNRTLNMASSGLFCTCSTKERQSAPEVSVGTSSQRRILRSFMVLQMWSLSSFSSPRICFWNSDTGSLEYALLSLQTWHQAFRTTSWDTDIASSRTTVTLQHQRHCHVGCMHGGAASVPDCSASMQLWDYSAAGRRGTHLLSPFLTSGRSPIVSRTVTARRRACLPSEMAV